MIVLDIDEKKYFGIFEEAIRKIDSPFELEVKHVSPSQDEIGEYLDNPHRVDLVFVALGRNVDTLKRAIGIVSAMREKNPFIMVVLMVDGGFVPLDAYEVRHVFAIRKPVTVENLSRAFKEISFWFNLNSSQILGNNVYVKWYSEKTKLSEDSIISVKSEKYGLVVTTVNGTYKHSGKLADFLVNLKSGTFFRCQCNVVVNFKHVKRINKDRVDMDNGDVVTVSRQYRKAVNEFVKNGLTNLSE